MESNKYKITFNNYYGDNPRECGDYFLIQLSDSMCAKDSIVPEHQQQCFEITFAYSGNGNSYVNDKSFPICKNDCFISLPGELHKIKSDDREPLHFICVAFSAKPNTYGEKLIQKIIDTCKSQRKFNVDAVRSILVNMIKEIRNEDEYSNRLLSYYIEQVLIQYHRVIISSKNKEKTDIDIPTKSLLAYDIMFYINDNVASIKKITDLEKVFYYKIPYLSRCFVELTGTSINNYYVSKKMELASNMLKEGKTVTKISEFLNYSSVHAFSRAYTKYFGTPPSKLKKRDQ